MNRGRAVIVVGALLVASPVLSGCGGDEVANADATTAATSSSPATSEPVVEETTPPPSKPRKASCTLKGSRPAKVTLVESDDALTATFVGQGVARTDTTSYFITVYDAAGETGGQMGVRYLDGKQIAYFIAVDSSGPQANLDGEAVVKGKRVVATFPKGVGGLGDFEIGQWNAAYTLAGEDVGMCPGNYESQPFPGA